MVLRKWREDFRDAGHLNKLWAGPQPNISVCWDRWGRVGRKEIIKKIIVWG